MNSAAERLDFEPEPTVGVVICAFTFDRWELMCRAVASVQGQTQRAAEIVLCIDHNPELAERARQRWPESGQAGTPVVQVVENRFEGRLGSARNTAIERLTSDIVAFLDDDAEAEPDWLATLVLAYRETGAVAVGGAPRPRFATARPKWFPTEFGWVFGCHYDLLPDTRQPVRHLIGANMSARLEELRKVGGFHSDNHDDMDMSHRIASEFGPSAVLYEPRAEVTHFVTEERVTWAYFWRRCFHVNAGKVLAFADLGMAGNLHAELDFARQMATSVLRRLRRAAMGDRDALSQAAAIVAGLGLAGLGHIRGKVELRIRRTKPSATRGLPA